MAGLDFVNNIIEQKLLSLHTCYIAKVLSVNEEKKTAKIQPLGKTKAYGKDAKTQSVLTNVPITNSAFYRFDTDAYTSSATYTHGGSLTVNIGSDNRKFAIVRKLRAGDLVVCVCGERDITDAKRGKNSTPPSGHHSMSDSIIIGSL